jgi:hypothetical protein
VRSIVRRFLSNENLQALILALVLLLLIVLTSDTSPRWIYQGF